MQKSGVCFTLHTTSNTLAVFVFQALVLSAIDVLFQGEMRGKFFLANKHFRGSVNGKEFRILRRTKITAKSSDSPPVQTKRVSGAEPTWEHERLVRVLLKKGYFHFEDF